MVLLVKTPGQLFGPRNVVERLGASLAAQPPALSPGSGLFDSVLTPGPVASTNQFLERIKHLKLEPDEPMVSFDVVSLFTSIPQQLAIDVMGQLLAERYEERDKPMKSENLLELLRYCLKTYFTFGGQMYEQIKDTPMGSPLSGLIDEVVLQRIEHLVFAKYQPKFWAHYVDNTFVVVKTTDIERLKELG
ncbi:hypothetical protein SprV_0702376800 [Sparganum proliferum]